MSLPRRTLLLAAGLTPVTAWTVKAADAARLVCPLLAEPEVLVPGASDSAATRLVGSKIYRGLCRFGLDNQPQSDLATTCTISPDGLTYSFALLPGVTWHDGAPFTADDVVFSIDRFHRVVTPRLQLDRVSSVQALDPQTAVVTLSQPFEPFLRQMDALSAPIVAKHVHDRPDWGLNPKKVAPVGTGPFRFDGWLRLVRFDWFVGTKPLLSGINFPVITDPAARLAAVSAGQPGLLAGDAVAGTALAQFRRVPFLAVEGEFPPLAGAMVLLRVNRHMPSLSDKRMRQALASAIDRAGVLQDGWMGLGRIATGPMAPVADIGPPGPGLPPYDPRAAAALLGEAGFRPADDGVRARLRHLIPPGAPWALAAARVAASLRQVGVELMAENVDWPEWRHRVAAGDYELASGVVDQTGDPVLDLAPYVADLPSIEAPLADGKPDEALRLLIDDMTAIWLVEPAIPVVRDRRLHLPRGIFGNFADAVIA
jgi:peptide/nickel transport system substrate-binding protein